MSNESCATDVPTICLAFMHGVVTVVSKKLKNSSDGRR